MEAESLNQSVASTVRTDICGNVTANSNLSGISSLFEQDKTMADKYDGVMYHMLPSGQKVNIKFTIPVLFREFIMLLEKEFVRSEWNIDDKFTVSSHIQGRKVKITVYEADKTIEISGPGHKLWRDITFKRIATNLCTRFIQSFSANSQDSINISKDQPDATSTPIVTGSNTASVPVLTPTGSSGHQRTPIERQMAAILESLSYHSKMIATLQEQLNNLTTQVVKLQEKSPVTTANTQENPPVTTSRISVDESVSSLETHLTCNNADPTIIRDTYQTPSLPKSKPKKKLKARRINNKSPQQGNSQNSLQLNDNVIRPVKTLIIGDSIIKGINEKGLKKHVHSHGISGATTETVLDQLSLFDLKNFSTVIISIGGNDISNGTNVEYVEEKYDQLIQYIQKINQDCKIVNCTACPRQDCNVSELNSILRSLSDEYSTHLVDMEEYFYNQDGTPTLRYYRKDKIHLSNAGIRRLLDAVEKSCDGLRLVENFEMCVFNNRRVGNRARNPHRSRPDKRQSTQPSNRQNNQQHRSRNYAASNRPQSCVKCGETNHSTFNCKHKEQIKCHSCGYLGHKQFRCPNK